MLLLEVLERGTASAHLVLLSNSVKMCKKPLLAVLSGPTISLSSCEKRLSSISIGWTFVWTVVVTLLLVHC
jgi:hypothetical protein